MLKKRVSNRKLHFRLSLFEKALSPKGPYSSSPKIRGEVVVVEGEEVSVFPSCENSYNSEFGYSSFRIFGGKSKITKKWTDLAGNVFVSCNHVEDFDFPWFDYERLKSFQSQLLELHGPRDLVVWVAVNYSNRTEWEICD